MTTASHRSLLEVQRVQLTDCPRTLGEIIHQGSFMDPYLLWGKCLWMEVHYSHGVARCIRPHRNLSPVTPSVEQKAGFEWREADEVLIASCHQFVFLWHVEEVVAVDTNNVPSPACAKIKAHCLWVAIHSFVDRETRLVAVAIPDW